MPLNPAIATLYSGAVLKNLDPAHVWAEGCNTNYEGEIKGKGDVLKILAIGRPTVSNYTAGSTITYQSLSPTNLVLMIDQDVIWAVRADALEAMLSKVNVFEQSAREGAWAFVDSSDQFLAKRMAAGAGVTTTAAQVGNGAADDKAFDVLEQMVLDIKNTAGVQPTDMHAFVPYWFMSALRRDQRFTGYGTDASRSTARGEAIIQLAGVTIHETTNALDGAGTGFDTDGPVNTVIVCSQAATTWGRHIPEEGLVQMIRNENNKDSFDDLMRGRYVYGATVVYPQLIGKCVVTKGDL